MTRITWLGACTAAVALLGASQGGAQSVAEGLGAYEYANSCASCHGVSGKGDGPMVSYLTSRPADLTVLQKENGGVFPVARIYDTINGTAGIGAHGSAEMPAWGQTFRQRVRTDPDFPPDVRAAYAEARILSLIEYIATLQAE